MSGIVLFFTLTKCKIKIFHGMIDWFVAAVTSNALVVRFHLGQPKITLYRGLKVATICWLVPQKASNVSSE